MRQGLGLSRHGHEQRLSLAEAVHRQRGRRNPRRDPDPARVVAHCRRRRRPVRGLADPRRGRAGPREIPREAFLAFCDALEASPEERLAERYRLPAAEVETLVPALMVYRALLQATVASRLVVPDASLRAGLLIDLTSGNGRPGEVEFEQQVLASAEALGRRYRFDADHGRAVMRLCSRLFDELQDEHGLGSARAPAAPGGRPCCTTSASS